MGRNFTGLIVLVVLVALIAFVAIRNNTQPNEPKTVAFAPARSASEDMVLPPDPPASLPAATVVAEPPVAVSPPTETVVIREPVAETEPSAPVAVTVEPIAPATVAEAQQSFDPPAAVAPSATEGPTVHVVRPQPEPPVVAAEETDLPDAPGTAPSPLTLAESADTAPLAPLADDVATPTLGEVDTAALSEPETASDTRPRVVVETPDLGVVDTSPRRSDADPVDAPSADVPGEAAVEAVAPETPASGDDAPAVVGEELPVARISEAPDVRAAAEPVAPVAPGEPVADAVAESAPAADAEASGADRIEAGGIEADAGEASGAPSLLGRFSSLFGEPAEPPQAVEDPADSVRDELDRLAALLDTPLSVEPPAETGTSDPAPLSGTPGVEVVTPSGPAVEARYPVAAAEPDGVPAPQTTARTTVASPDAETTVAVTPGPAAVETEPAASTLSEAPAVVPADAPPAPLESTDVPVAPPLPAAAEPVVDLPEPVAEVRAPVVEEAAPVAAEEPRAAPLPEPLSAPTAGADAPEPAAGEQVPVDVVAPEIDSPPVDAQPQAPTVVALAPEAVVPESEPAASQVSALVAPTFDIVRVEPSGDVVAAGLADPGATVEMLDGLEALATARANESGEWAIVLDRPLAPGAHDLSLRTTTDGGSMATLSDQRVAVSVPERGQSGVLVVVNTSEGPSEVLQVPVATPPAETRVEPPPGVTAAAPAGEPAEPAVPETVREVVVTSVEADTAGTIYVTGTASTDDPVRVYLDNRPLGDARPMPDGLWALEVPREVPPGSYEVRADQIDAAGDVVARAAVPFEREVEVLELRPVASVGAAGGTEAEGSVPGMRTVVIQRGDNLWKLSRRIYGRGVRFSNIYEANRDQITNPRWIYPGQVFLVPEGNTAWPETAAPVD